MRELLIVVSDFYLPDSGASRFVSADSSLVGLATAIRFGATHGVDGWRPFLASWLGRADLASAAPASVASAVLREFPDAPSTLIAQPVHLITGLRSVHLDHAGLLRLDPLLQAQLVESFAKDFANTPYQLIALPSGSFLLTSQVPLNTQSSDPARYLGSSIEGAFTAQRLGAEMEMWLHEHPVNISRSRVRQRSINTLWLWGGGPPLAPSAKQAGEVKQALFGVDAYSDGLVALGAAQRSSPASHDFSAVMRSPAERAAVIVEAFRLPENSAVSTPMQALEEIDRLWIAPALEATLRGQLHRLHIVANDRCVVISARDRLKFWRRSRSALAALQ